MERDAEAQPVSHAPSDNPRVPISHETREMAVNLIWAGLLNRIEKHGENSHASVHEGLGIITVEYHELIEAIHSDHNQLIISEAIDVAVGCLWLVATLLAKDPSIEWHEPDPGALEAARRRGLVDGYHEALRNISGVISVTQCQEQLESALAGLKALHKALEPLHKALGTIPYG